MAFTTIPTPIYALYQDRDGFPTWVITVVFAAYAVGVALSLYLAGHVSDWLGRRPVLMAALGIEILSAVLFLVWNDVAGLVVARFVSGLGIGALTATATAHLSELRAVGRPSSRIAPLASNFANIGGLALGPLLAGVIITLLPAPLAAPYAILLGALLVLLLAVAVVPETVTATRRRYRPQRVAVPTESRAEFWAAGAGAFAGFAVFGFVMALTPTVLSTAMGITSRVAAGAVPFAVFMSAAVAQVLTARLPLRRQLILSWLLMGIGISLMAIAVLWGILWLYVLAGVAAGAGVGILFRGSLGVAAGLAPDDARGEVLAAMFLLAYIGLAVPTLLIGTALVWLPLTTALIGFAGAVLAIVSLAIPRMLRRLTR